MLGFLLCKVVQIFPIQTDGLKSFDAAVISLLFENICDVFILEKEINDLLTIKLNQRNNSISLRLEYLIRPQIVIYQLFGV